MPAKLPPRYKSKFNRWRDFKKGGEAERKRTGEGERATLTPMASDIALFASMLQENCDP
jgi:hypothetical protein